MPDHPVAVITAAGKGIGAACARELAARGYRLVLMSPSEAVLDLAGELDCLGIQGSVTVEADLEKLVSTTLVAHDRIDAVINNTGHAPGSVDYAGEHYDREGRGQLLHISDDDWLAAFEIYFLNVVRFSRLVTPHMQTGGGAIINISASSADEPNFAYPASSTIRAALSGFMKLYADRYGRDGIRMNNLLPGYLSNWEWPQSLLDEIPVGRAGTPEEVAKLAAFLISPDAAYITGQNITIDGGFNRRP